MIMHAFTTRHNLGMTYIVIHHTSHHIHMCATHFVILNSDSKYWYLFSPMNVHERVNLHGFEFLNFKPSHGQKSVEG